MAITFIGGNIIAGANVTSVPITYSPTAGNIVCVFLAVAGGISNVSCKDSSNNALIAGPIRANTQEIVCFYYTAPSGITGFTCSWTSSRICVASVVEYSGVINVNANLPGNTSFGTSANPFITQTLDDGNDYLLAGVVSGNTFAVVTGNSRKQVTSGALRLTVADNTASTAVAVSVSGGQTSASWAVVSLELVVRPNTWDTDAETQLIQPDSLPVAYTMQQLADYGCGDYDPRTPRIPTIRYDTDADQQSLQPQQFSQDDEQDIVQLIVPLNTITDYTWDDVEQRPQASWLTTQDLYESRDKLILLPDRVFDNDSEQQKLQDPWTLDKDLAQNIVQLVTPVSTITDYTWDDHQQKPYDSWVLNIDVDTSVGLPLPLISATDVIISAYSGYWALLPNDDEGVERLPVVTLLTEPLDNDVEHQLNMQAYYPDLNLYDGTNLVIVPPYIDTIEIVGE